MIRRIFAASLLLLPVTAMAQVAISQLPAATTLDGTEVLPIVQSGQTRKATTLSVGELGAGAGCIPFEVYGGSTASADNTAAWNTFVAAAGSNSACLTFKAGTYTFTSSSPLAVTLSARQSLALRGQSLDGTKLKFTNGGGIAFTFGSQIASVHVRDLTAVTSLTPSAAGTTAAFSLLSSLSQGNNQLNTFTNVGCSGLDRYSGGTSNYWNYCFYDHNVPMVSIINPQIWGAYSQLGTGGGGTGVYTYGDAGGTGAFPAVILISNGDFQNNNIGVDYGPYSQGMMINNTSFVAVNVGVKSRGETQLAISNSEFDSYTYSVQQTATTNDLILQGNLFFPNINSTGIYINAGSRMTIGGNSIVCTSATGTTGIDVNATSAFNAAAITGNSLENCAQAVQLGSGSSGVALGPNAYRTNTADWVNNASGTANSVLEAAPTSIGYNGPLGLLQFTGSTNGYQFSTDVSTIGTGTNVRLRADATFGYLLGNTVTTGYNSARPFLWNISTGAVVIDQGAAGTTMGGNLRLALTNVAALPACAAGSEGALRAITDATSATFNAAVAGGGGNHVMAYCNGTGWVVH